MNLPKVNLRKIHDRYYRINHHDPATGETTHVELTCYAGLPNVWHIEFNGELLMHCSPMEMAVEACRFFLGNNDPTLIREFIKQCSSVEGVLLLNPEGE